ncbi:LysM peptidoglycan-binding domain-containing protein [Hassallia byssoidea VB512170]|uniref:LysM peptidoglycan-binding domain-containing protein n=1 Tax=Hassallia byssoidea VB512170 TaxID=1304833 RepID=A0A846HFE7_9CYAN|nr:LysM peptidoglycan-binding domain-containing protein [Hassalia byssoidea]NEU76052.1 LysM peptidoglycan-binding domain-containing protein [Hassalia byssoidea VB512170]
MFESPLSQQNPLNTSINPTFHNSELNLEPNRGIFSSSQTNSGFSQLKIENYNLTVSSSFSDRLLPLPTYDKLNSAVFLKQSLNKFVQLPNCGQLMQSIFGANFNIEKLNGIIYQWLVGDFSNLPKIEVREESVFPTNTLGAFAEATEKIYLSQRLLNSGNTVKIGNTILEEIGHWLDKQLNVADTPGDEGQMFAAVVTGQHLNADQIAEIRAEDDSTTIYVDGQLLKVEQSTLVLPTITISANDANASETLTGQIANPGQFTFTRTGSTTSALTVNYAVGGTATNGVDYSTLTNSVTFTAGASTAIININPIDDSVFEGNETVVLALANNTNYVIGAANNTTVVIADNDQPNITVINPNGGNSLQAGNSYNITWNDNISENVKIDLYKAGNLYSTLFSSTTSDGGETWTLPSNLASGSDYKIKITSVNNGNLFDFSDANFTINSVPFDYAGNSLIQARNIGTLSSKQYFSDFVGDADTNDYYKFSVSSPSNFNLSLSGLSGNADVQLIQDINGNSQIDANEILGSSILTGSSAESISVPLFSGNYYVRIYPSGNGINTNYNLNLSATSLGNYNYTDPSPTNNTYYNTPVTRSFFNSNEIGVYQSQYATSLMYGSIADYYTNNQYANQNTTNGLFGVYSGLGLPTSPIYKKDDGSFVMDFEGGTLTNRNGIVTPFYNQKASSFALVGQGAPDGTELQWKNDYSYWSKNVGTPTTAVRYVAGGWVQEFADSQGNIINIFSVKNGQQLTQGGPYRVQGAMLDIYRLTGGYERQNGGLGFATQITEQSNVNGYKHYQTFENGFIGVTADNKITIKNWQGQLINVVGYDGVAINSTYRNTFNRDGGTASLGSPINNVHSWGNGYIQDFTGGSDGKGGIMKSNANDNSYWVGGDFWNKFVEAGGAGGILYYPTSDRYSTVNGALRQDFQGGAIIKSDKGIFTVYGGIGSQYLKVEGGEKGRLGLPTSGEVGIGNGVVVQNFEKGRIVWNNGSTRTEMYGQTPSQPPQTGGSSFSYGGNTYQWTSYTIRDGDSLSAIAQRTLGDANGYNFIAQRNGISNPNKINAGQVIEVPLLLNGSNPPVQTPSQPPQTGGSSFNYGGKAYQWTSYTIKSGDSLSAIAQRTLGDANGYSVIAQRNGISNPNNVYGGQVIDIPVLFNNSNSPFVPPQQPAQTGSVFDIAVNNAINRIGGLGVVGKLIISPTHVSTNDGSGWFEEFQAANGEQRLLALQDGKSTAYWVHGDNLREYLKWGGAYGALGLPTNEETQFTASQTGTKGIWQGFSGSGGKARIYNHPTLGSVATWGSIGSFYEDMGAANSWLGLPTKAEQQAADGVTIWAEFERGKIVFNQQTGKSEALRTGQPPSWISIKGTDSQSISGITIDPGSVTKKVEGLIGTYAFIIDRLNYKDLSNGSRVLSFDVFNTGYAQGVIEVRNAQGQLVEIRGIEGIRNPTSVFGFGIESIQRLWRLATEGYGFTDPRNSLGSSEKTEIRNVVIPPGGSLKITKTGTYAAAYNLAKIGMDLLFEFGLPKVFEENYSLKMKLWSAIYAEVLQENVKSLAADGEFNLNTSEDARKSLEASNWLNKQELAKLTEISIKVLAEELPTFKFYSQYSLLAPAQQIVDNLEKLNSWITLAETFAKGSNTFLQSLDLERAKKLEPTTQLIKFITK